MIGRPNKYTTPDSIRMTAKKRVAILTNIAEGKLTVAQACALYGLFTAELDTWVAKFSKHGPVGLKATFQPMEAKQSRRKPRVWRAA